MLLKHPKAVSKRRQETERRAVGISSQMPDCFTLQTVSER
jgi:hypothetical protein